MNILIFTFMSLAHAGWVYPPQNPNLLQRDLVDVQATTGDLSVDQQNLVFMKTMAAMTKAVGGTQNLECFSSDNSYQSKQYPSKWCAGGRCVRLYTGEVVSASIGIPGLFNWDLGHKSSANSHDTRDVESAMTISSCTFTTPKGLTCAYSYASQYNCQDASGAGVTVIQGQIATIDPSTGGYYVAPPAPPRIKRKPSLESSDGLSGATLGR